MNDQQQRDNALSISDSFIVQAPAGSGKTKNLVGDCVCPEGQAEDGDGVCQGTGDGGGECPEGQTKDFLGNCVAPPVTPTAPSELFGVSKKPGEVVDIDYMYDPFGTSIFAPNVEQEKDPVVSLYSGYAEGGIVQDYDVEQLIAYLKGSGN